MKKWSECIKRALRTFIEAAAAYLAAHIVLAVSTGGEDLSVMRTALMGLAVSSVAAGLAAPDVPAACALSRPRRLPTSVSIALPMSRHRSSRTSVPMLSARGSAKRSRRALKSR